MQHHASEPVSNERPGCRQPCSWPRCICRSLGGLGGCSVSRQCVDFGRQFNAEANIAPCKRIHEGPGFRILASRFRIPASGFWIPTIWIPDSNLLDSGFHTLWIPDSSPWVPNSNSKNLLDSGFRILLLGVGRQIDRPSGECFITAVVFR